MSSAKKNIAPPKLATHLLHSFLRNDLAEEVEGDLEEKFYTDVKLKSLFKAKLNYWFQVINYLRPFALRKSKSVPLNISTMFRHNLLISFRNFSRYKSSFIINMIGLTSGLASVLLIYLWVFDEMSIDNFYEKGDRLYQVMRHTPDASNNFETHGSNSVLLPDALKEEMPDVEFVVPMRPTPTAYVSADKANVKTTGSFVGKDFFNVFSYKLIQGSSNGVLQNKYAMVISDDLAIKLFGSAENCVGKSVNWGLEHFGGDHIVSGVFESPGDKASEKYDFLVTHELFLEKNRMDVNWDSNPIFTYLTLKPGVAVEQFNLKLNNFYKEKRETDADQMFLQLYSDRYLYGGYENGKLAGGRIDYVILFSLIAGFILVIACINFMNLSTARASRRLKEVGIKKSIGVFRKTIVFQHLSESMLVATLAFVVAVGVVIMLLPQFNLLTGKHIQLTPEWGLISGALVIVILTGIMAGSYPAFYISGFRPIDILKGKLNTALGEIWIRRGLVIFQFGISIVLIAAVCVIYLQMDFVQSKNLGFNKANIISFEKEGKLVQSLESFLNEAKTIPGVLDASSTQGSVANISSSSWGHTWEGQVSSENEIEFSGVTINYDFFETLSIPLKEGRTFSREFGNEESTIILNEKAVEVMQMADPVGKWINLFGTQREIIGTVKNFHFQSMYEEIKPMFLMCFPIYTNTVLVKIQSGTELETLAGLEKLYKQYNPDIPFEAKFLDDDYQALYISEKRIATLSKYFATIAIVISCLGLFGMAAFAAERRTKEISIRKTLGASEWIIVRLLSKELTITVLTAVVLTIPASFYLSTYWLNRFAYRIELRWWLFISIGTAALLIAWFAVGYQTIKAARSNPVDSLKSE